MLVAFWSPWGISQTIQPNAKLFIIAPRRCIPPPTTFFCLRFLRLCVWRCARYYSSSNFGFHPTIGMVCVVLRCRRAFYHRTCGRIRRPVANTRSCPWDWWQSIRWACWRFYRWSPGELHLPIFLDPKYVFFQKSVLYEKVRRICVALVWQLRIVQIF